MYLYTLQFDYKIVGFQFLKPAKKSVCGIVEIRLVLSVSCHCSVYI